MNHISQQNLTKHWFSTLLYGVIWGGFLSVFIWFILFMTTGGQFTLVRWLSYIAPWLIIGLLSFLGIALLLKKKSLLAVFLFSPY